MVVRWFSINRTEKLEISKPIMHEFWYNCIKSKYQQNAKLRYMDTDCFIVKKFPQIIHQILILKIL